MKKHIKFFTIILLIKLSGILSPIFGQWQKFVIDDNTKSACTADIGDVDGDNRPDIIASIFSIEKFHWYQNNSSDWIPHTIDSTGILNNLTFAWFADVNVDGRLDVVAVLYNSKKLVWYENPDWTEHTIDNSTDNADFMIVADIDGNDTVDVVAAGGTDVCKLVWYENKYPVWITHYIDSRWDKYSGATVSDFDGDGSLDVGAVIYQANKVVWYKNEDNGDSWTQNIIDDKLEGAWQISSGDIDGDDRIDVVASSGYYYFEEGGDLVWYKNQQDGWLKNTIDQDQQGFLPTITDINGDGNLDILSSVLKAPNVCWYEKINSTWTKHVIDENMSGLRFSSFGDIDGDSINDVVVAGGNKIAWYKNPFTPLAYATSVEVSPACTQYQCNAFSIIASLNNPENHPLDVLATIYDANSNLIDTLLLLDDGTHGDANSADNIWGGKIFMQNQPEGIYTVKLATHDNHYIDMQDVIYPLPVRFTTIGPVSLDSWSIVTSDTVFDPGDVIEINLTLKNNGSTAAASEIEAKLTSLDELVSVSAWKRNFGDIAAGESSTSDYYAVKISDEWSGISQVPLLVEIYSSDYMYWKDTLNITVQGPTSIEDIREPMARLYPNPTSDVLNIEINSIDRQSLEIEILDITGKFIYQKEYRSITEHFTEQIDLSGYSNGIYFVKVRQDNSVYVGKVVVK